MDEIKNKIEAVLFTLGKFVSVEELARACEIDSITIVQEKLEELKKDYETKDGAIEIQQVDNLYKLNVKKHYGLLTNKLLSASEMDGPTTKTLAVIAYKAPTLQAEIIHIRGNKAYDHIQQLKENGLIISEPKGRSRLIKLTPQFYDYFDTAEPEVKKQFLELEKKLRSGVDVSEKSDSEKVEEAVLDEKEDIEEAQVDEEQVDEEENLDEEPENTNK